MNLFSRENEKTDSEITDIIVENKKMRIEKITSDGQVSDWYNQNEDEWVSLLEGEAELEYADSVLKLTKGEHVYIPANTLHRVKKQGKCIWLCVFLKNPS